MRYLIVLLFVTVVFVAAPALAQESAGEVDPIVALLTSLLGAGIFAKWGALIGAGVVLLRAGAATLSKYVTDEKLGWFAKPVNYLAGNTRHAANA